MFRTVCFDLMDTVLVDPYREALRAATGMGLEEIHTRRDPAVWREFELDEIDESEFLRRFFDDGTPLDVATFHRVRRAGYRWLPGMRELIQDLAARVDCHVASNYPVWIEELRRRFGLDALFAGVWASHRLGARKPHPDFYRRLVTQAEIDPGTSLFVDDRKRNCEGAEAQGFATHLFTGAEDLRRRLVAEGLLPEAGGTARRTRRASAPGRSLRGR